MGEDGGRTWRWYGKEGRGYRLFVECPLRMSFVACYCLVKQICAQHLNSV